MNRSEAVAYQTQRLRNADDAELDRSCRAARIGIRDRPDWWALRYWDLCRAECAARGKPEVAARAEAAEKAEHEANRAANALACKRMPWEEGSCEKP